MKKVIVIILFLFLNSCGVSKKNNPKLVIVGKWCLVDKKSINYPTITFDNEGIAIFTSKMDTVYSYKYFIKNDELNLIQPSRKVNVDKIIKISKDSLVLKSLLENKKEQIYYRCK